MSNYGDTPDETPQDPYGQPPQDAQTPPPAAPNYGQPTGAPYGQAPAVGASTYSVGDAFRYGWAKFQANVGPLVIATLVLVGALVVIVVVQAMLSGGATVEFNPDGSFETNQSFASTLVGRLFFNLLTNLALVAVQAAIIKGALDLTKGRQLTVGTMFEGINWLQVLIAALIIAVASAIGFILLVIPMFIVMFLSAYTIYFIVDKDQTAIEAIQSSIKFTIANAGTVILLFLASVAAYFVGALLCGIGLLVAFPVVAIAQAYTYRTLNGEQVAA